jgi:DNA-binding transcriptional MerR regulator
MDDDDEAALQCLGSPSADGPPSGGWSELTIGEMAQRFGLTARALRFYEAKGLLVPRRAGRARLYGPAECERLALVLKAKRLGFTLAEIRQMLAAPEPAGSGDLNLGRRQCFEQIKWLEERKREIEAALAELRRTYSSFYARSVARMN